MLFKQKRFHLWFYWKEWGGQVNCPEHEKQINITLTINGQSINT